MENLLVELRLVETLIKEKEDKLANIPSILKCKKKEMSSLKSSLDSMKIEKKKQIPGTADEDKKKIADIDQIYMKPLDMLKSILAP